MRGASARRRSLGCRRNPWLLAMHAESAGGTSSAPSSARASPPRQAFRGSCEYVALLEARGHKFVRGARFEARDDPSLAAARRLRAGARRGARRRRQPEQRQVRRSERERLSDDDLAFINGELDAGLMAYTSSTSSTAAAPPRKTAPPSPARPPTAAAPRYRCRRDASQLPELAREIIFVTSARNTRARHSRRTAPTVGPHTRAHLSSLHSSVLSTSATPRERSPRPAHSHSSQLPQSQPFHAFLYLPSSNPSQSQWGFCSVTSPPVSASVIETPTVL